MGLHFYRIFSGHKCFDSKCQPAVRRIMYVAPNRLEREQKRARQRLPIIRDRTNHKRR